MNIYREKVLDHFKNPRNFGEIKDSTRSRHGENPSCGDSITIDVLIKGDTIKDIKFSGEGCAIAISSTSMLSERIKGMKLTRIADITLKDVEKMLGISLNPARKNCAQLPLTIIKKIVLTELKKK